MPVAVFRDAMLVAAGLAIGLGLTNIYAIEQHRAAADSVFDQGGDGLWRLNRLTGSVSLCAWVVGPIGADGMQVSRLSCMPVRG